MEERKPTERTQQFQWIQKCDGTLWIYKAAGYTIRITSATTTSYKWRLYDVTGELLYIDDVRIEGEAEDLDEAKHNSEYGLMGYLAWVKDRIRMNNGISP